MMPVGEFTHDLLRSRYGAGKYKVRVKGPKGFLPGGGLIKIADTEVPRHANGDLGSFIEAMERRDADRRKEASEKMNRLTELGIPALTTIVAALLSRNTQPDMVGLLAALKPAPGPTLNDIVGTLASMQAFNGGNQKTDPFDTILKMMEAVKNLTGDNNASPGESKLVDVVRDLVKEAVPAVRPMLENLANQAQQAQQRQMQQPPLVIQPMNPGSVNGATTPPVSLPASVAAIESAGTVGIPSIGDTDMMALVMPTIQSALKRIVSWAKVDRDPSAYAVVFMDETPQWIASYLTPQQTLEYLNHPQWFDKICEVNGELREYKDWCDEFRQELIELVSQTIEDTEAETLEKVKEVPPQIIEDNL